MSLDCIYSIINLPLIPKKERGDRDIVDTRIPTVLDDFRILESPILCLINMGNRATGRKISIPPASVAALKEEILPFLACGELISLPFIHRRNSHSSG